MVRQPAVAGAFYPQDSGELIAQLERIVPLQRGSRNCLGLVSPHAGYVYSGAIAGELFAQVRLPRQVVILGPNHQGLGSDVALFDEGSWQTPLGQVPIAAELAAHLLRSCPQLQVDPAAHRFEHSLEVQVPLLQYLQPALQIVPICLGSGTLDDWLALGTALGSALNAWDEEVLIVASSDMSHFLDAAETQRRDRLAIDAVLALDPVLLWQTVRENRISMCGVIPALVMLQAALQRGASACELVCYGHSGEVNGDMSRVVGYAALAVS
ncbi:MAG: AmmeMemoRadiSam system protein B [Desulfuromonadales bacterium]|nr:AmmeMemoRadiSam system protein B [Desulfuromonadales bacterium]